MIGTESGAGKRARMPESADEFYARIAAAADDEGRLAFRPGVEDWETFPLASPSWRLRQIGPLLDAERPRSAENAADCWCREVDADLDHVHAKIVWRDAHWVLGASRDTGIPVTLFLEPRRHGDLADMSEERAAEMGRLLVAAAVEALPSVAQAHVCRWGDGSAHLHWWVIGPPGPDPATARVVPPAVGAEPRSHVRSTERAKEYLPRIPADVRDENVRFVVDGVVDAYGGVPVGAVPDATPDDG